MKMFVIIKKKKLCAKKYDAQYIIIFTITNPKKLFRLNKTIVLKKKQ